MKYKPTQEELNTYDNRIFYEEEGEMYTNIAFINLIEQNTQVTTSTLTRIIEVEEEEEYLDAVGNTQTRTIKKEKQVTEEIPLGEPVVIPNEFKDKVSNSTQSNEYVIYDLVDSVQIDKTKQPKHIIFPEGLNQNLYKQYNLYYGDKVQTIYYSGFNLEDGTVFNPVVKIDYTYHRDTDHSLMYKERTFSWFKRDGNWGTDTYTDIVPYTTTYAKQRELELVRENIEQEARALAVSLGLGDAISEMYELYQNQIRSYVITGSPKFSQTLSTLSPLTHPWLEQRTSDDKMTVQEFLTQFFLIATF